MKFNKILKSVSHMKEAVIWINMLNLVFMLKLKQKLVMKEVIS